MQEYAFIIPILIVQAFLAVVLSVLAVRAFKEARAARRPQVQKIQLVSNGLTPIFRRTNG
jgi:hypothetical protein